MEPKEHDQLARRLTEILVRLNGGIKLNLKELAKDFGVSTRTIHRDLNDRFAFLPLNKEGTTYTLDPHYLGKISFRDIERFASLAGLKGLFPGLDNQFFRELLDTRLGDALHIQAPSYEDLKPREIDFRSLQTAINKRRKVRFTYKKSDGEKTVEIEPYRLINNAGIWYLAGVHESKPKSYAFGRLSLPTMTDIQFEPDPAICTMLDEEDSIWLNQKKTEVVLKIAPPAAIYFKRRKLIAQQMIEKELEDGGLIVSGKFAHPNQILPIVRYWIPHVRIVNPEGWQDVLLLDLKEYLKN